MQQPPNYYLRSAIHETTLKHGEGNGMKAKKYIYPF